MVPAASTFLMTWLNVSAMYMSPAVSNAIVRGSFSRAPVAGPPSPEYPGNPLPATVVMIPAADHPGTPIRSRKLTTAATVTTAALDDPPARRERRDTSLPLQRTFGPDRDARAIFRELCGDLGSLFGIVHTISSVSPPGQPWPGAAQQLAVPQQGLGQGVLEGPGLELDGQLEIT